MEQWNIKQVENIYIQLEVMSGREPSQEEVDEIIRGTGDAELFNILCKMVKMLKSYEEESAIEGKRDGVSLKHVMEDLWEICVESSTREYISMNQFLRMYYVINECEIEEIFNDDRFEISKDNNERIISDLGEIVIKYNDKDYWGMLAAWRKMLPKIYGYERKETSFLYEELTMERECLESQKIDVKLMDLKRKLFGVIDSILGKNGHELLMSKEKSEYKLTDYNCYFLKKLLDEFEQEESKALRKKEYHKVSKEYLWSLKIGFTEFVDSGYTQLDTEFIDKRWNNTYFTEEVEARRNIIWLLDSGKDLFELLLKEDVEVLIEYPDEIKECKEGLEKLLQRVQSNLKKK